MQNAANNIDWQAVRKVAEESIAASRAILSAINSSQAAAAPTGGPVNEIARVEMIIRLTAEFYGLTEKQMCRPQRTAEIAWTRQVAMFLCREMTVASSDFIGQRIGRRNHGTVLHGVKVVAARIETEARRAAEVKALREKIFAALNSK